MPSTESLRRGDIVKVEGNPGKDVIFVVYRDDEGKIPSVGTLTLVDDPDGRYIYPIGGGIPISRIQPTTEHLTETEFRELFLRGAARSGFDDSFAQQWLDRTPETQTIRKP